MTLDFNADEIFEMAEQIERNGVKFYTKAAENFDDAKTKDLLRALARQEVEHEKTFQKLRKDLASMSKEAATFDPDGLAQEYLHAFAGGYVFDVTVDPSETLTGEESLEDVLRQAIGLEKDSIVFYMGMKEITPEKLGRKHVDDIIKEEMRHVTQLTQQLRLCKK